MSIMTTFQADLDDVVSYTGGTVAADGLTPTNSGTDVYLQIKFPLLPPGASFDFNVGPYSRVRVAISRVGNLSADCQMYFEVHEVFAGGNTSLLRTRTQLPLNSSDSVVNYLLQFPHSAYSYNMKTIEVRVYIIAAGGNPKSRCSGKIHFQEGSGIQWEIHTNGMPVNAVADLAMPSPYTCSADASSIPGASEAEFFIAPYSVNAAANSVYQEGNFPANTVATIPNTGLATNGQPFSVFLNIKSPSPHVPITVDYYIHDTWDDDFSSPIPEFGVRIFRDGVQVSYLVSIGQTSWQSDTEVWRHSCSTSRLFEDLPGKPVNTIVNYELRFESLYWCDSPTLKRFILSHPSAAEITWADAAGQVAPFSGAATATYSVLSASASGSLALQPFTLSGTASALASYSATGAFTLVDYSVSGVGAFTAPAFNASGAVTLASYTLSGSATATVPAFSANGAITLQPSTLSANVVAPFPTFNAATAFGLQPHSLAANATATVPVFSATGGVVLPSYTLVGEAGATPAYSAAGTLSTPSYSVAGVGAYSVSARYANAGVEVATFALDATVTTTRLSYSASSDLNLFAFSFVGYARTLELQLLSKTIYTVDNANFVDCFDREGVIRIAQHSNLVRVRG